MTKYSQPLPGPGRALACWDDLAVAVAYDGEAVTIDGLHFSSSDGQLVVAPA